MPRYSKYLIVLTLAITANGQGPSPVQVQPVTIETISDIKSVTGSLRAALKSDIASIESGRIDEIHIKEGQSISKGEVIAKLDNRRIIHDIDRVKAEANETKSRIRRNEQELKIHSEDYEALLAAEKSFTGSVSGQRLREARLKTVTSTEEINVLRTSLFVLQAELDRLQTSLADTVIKAAFSGVITSKHVDLGSWVTAGDPVVSIIDNQRLEAWLDIPETIPIQLLTKDHVTVSVNESRISAKSLRVIPKVNERSRNYQLIVELDGADSTLVPGMSVAGTVPNGSVSPQLLVPFDAIQRNGAGYFVFKAQPMPDGMSAMPVPIDIRFRTGTHAAVTADSLAPGDQVITEGNERLFPMMPITIIDGAHE